ncbi:putative lipid carrier protein YhbT [Neorhizobium galegae]|nr:putative lipid carrier protein YhbT [Neorhizobium galegae]
MEFPGLPAIPLNYMPLAAIERAAGLLFERVLKEHPDLFERLGAYKAKRFAFLPGDLPLAFIV